MTLTAGEWLLLGVGLGGLASSVAWVVALVTATRRRYERAAERERRDR